MPVGISACFATVELDMSACATLEGGGSVEQCTIGLVATELKSIGTRGGGVANVRVPAKEIAGGTISIVGIPNGEKGNRGGGYEDWKLQLSWHHSRY